MWYVVNGEIRGQSAEAVMVVDADGYDDACEKLQARVGPDRPLYCMNCDILTRDTAASYRVDYAKREKYTMRHPDLI